MRRAYGVRLRMLHERAALLNGLALMWTDKVKPLDPELFCLIGQTSAKQAVNPEPHDTQDHLVNVLASEIMRNERHIDVEALTAMWNKWRVLPEEQPKESCDGKCQ